MLSGSCTHSVYTNTETGTSNVIIKRHSENYSCCFLPVNFSSQVSIGLVVHTVIIIVIIIIIIIKYYYYYYYYYYLLQLSFHSVAVVLTLVQTKQIRINT